MIAEAARCYPLETGGVLMGYRTSSPASEAVVTDVIGPGSNAVHERYRFVPDADCQDDQIARIYAASGRRTTYLGDWHTHPGTKAAVPSRKDRRTLRRIAAEGAARAPCPFMIILTEGSERWVAWAWQGTLVRFAGIPLRLAVQRAPLNIF